MVIANDILLPEIARLIAEGKEVRFTPSGVSMRPFIEGGKDSVILASLARLSRRGDIVLAKAQNSLGQTTYVLHRILRIENDNTIVLQGDGNLTGEEKCRREDIIGQVIRIERPNGSKKCLSRGLFWQALLPLRKWLLKIYRHTWLKWCY